MTDRRSPQTALEAAGQVVSDLVGNDLSAAADPQGAAQQGVDPERLTRLVERVREGDRLKLELASVNKEVESLKEALLEEFIAAGCRQIKTRDGATVSIARSEFFGAVRLPGEDKSAAEERVAAQLEELGLDFMVNHKTTLNLGAIKAHLEEQRAMAAAAAGGDQQLDDSLVAISELIRSAEVFELRVRRN